jgi:hypothetical protein
MSPLPADICRCVGLHTESSGMRETCPKRLSCARFVSHAMELRERTPCGMWLCATDSFEMFISRAALEVDAA